jgi:hypothetical protein
MWRGVWAVLGSPLGAFCLPPGSQAAPGPSLLRDPEPRSGVPVYDPGCWPFPMTSMTYLTRPSPPFAATKVACLPGSRPRATGTSTTPGSRPRCPSLAVSPPTGPSAVVPPLQPTAIDPLTPVRQEGPDRPSRPGGLPRESPLTQSRRRCARGASPLPNNRRGGTARRTTMPASRPGNNPPSAPPVSNPTATCKRPLR